MNYDYIYKMIKLINYIQLERFYELSLHILDDCVDISEFWKEVEVKRL